MNRLYLIAAAYIIDLIAGDPYWFPHPVRGIGYFIVFLEKIIRRIFKTESALKTGGVILLFITSGISMALTWLILKLLFLINPFLSAAGFVVLAYTTLSVRCLANESNKVKSSLSDGLYAARKQVANIVGRNTSSLSPEDIIRAAVETVAENTTDGVISPLFYLFIGGPIAAMGFKAVSTLDSMVGYQNEKYRNLGWASARMDDILNFIPARITGILLVAAAFILELDYRKAFAILKRDHANHESPNCAWSEAAVSGALGILLGGTHDYDGTIVVKPSIGDDTRQPVEKDISKTNKLMLICSVLAIILFSAITLFFIIIF